MKNPDGPSNKIVLRRKILIMACPASLEAPRSLWFSSCDCSGPRIYSDPFVCEKRKIVLSPALHRGQAKTKTRLYCEKKQSAVETGFDIFLKAKNARRIRLSCRVCLLWPPHVFSLMSDECLKKVFTTRLMSLQRLSFSSLRSLSMSPNSDILLYTVT